MTYTFRAPLGRYYLEKEVDIADDNAIYADEYCRIYHLKEVDKFLLFELPGNKSHTSFKTVGIIFKRSIPVESEVPFNGSFSTFEFGDLIHHANGTGRSRIADKLKEIYPDRIIRD